MYNTLPFIYFIAMRFFASISLNCLMLLFFNACTTAVKIPVNRQTTATTCYLENNFDFSKPLPVPLHKILLDSSIFERYSLKSLNIAHSFGFLDLLLQNNEAAKKYAASPNLENRLQNLEFRVRLDEQINQASLEVSSMAAELDCEEERITQVADYVKAKEKQRETKLTVSAIVVGAAGGIASGLLSTNEKAGNAGDYVGIATGIGEAALGVMILRNNMTVEFKHQRNALRDIWNNVGHSEIFPPAIWYYLTYRDPAKYELSLREKIIERWKSYGQVNAGDAVAEKKFAAVYLGDQGIYSTDDLYNRAKMYDQIESSVKIIKQDLTRLSSESLKE